VQLAKERLARCDKVFTNLVVPHTWEPLLDHLALCLAIQDETINISAKERVKAVRVNVRIAGARDGLGSLIASLVLCW
jgi:hypothetical protein